MPDKHAFLSASSSDRWIHCPPSAKLNALIADKQTSFTQEGTEAHLVCEYELKKMLGQPMHDPRPDLEDYGPEMQEAADGYRDFVSEKAEEIQKLGSEPFICVEQRLDYSQWVEMGFGTGDCVIVADKVMHIIDFKYGIGVLVDARMNPQLLCYGLGGLDAFGDLYDIDTIKLSIYQPRRGNISTFEISKSELLNWADTVLVPAAKLAYVGQGDFSVGNWCRFCKVKGVCRKRAEVNMEMAKCQFLEPAMLQPDDYATLLPQIDQMMDWGEEIKKAALDLALGGMKIPHYKVVEGRSNRTYKNEAKVAETVRDAGFDPYDQKLKGITAMNKMLGKKKFDSLLGKYITKPAGKPVLVDETDPRPEVRSAAEDFKDE